MTDAKDELREQVEALRERLAPIDEVDKVITAIGLGPVDAMHDAIVIARDALACLFSSPTLFLTR